MASKNTAQVLIDGKIYSVSGYESEDYLQRVAAYLNNKISEIKEMEGYNKLPAETKALLLELNVADDYFKLKKDASDLSAQIADKDKETYEVKHELIAAQMTMESTKKELETLQEEEKTNQKRIVELEAQLKEKQRKDHG